MPCSGASILDGPNSPVAKCRRPSPNTLRVNLGSLNRSVAISNHCSFRCSATWRCSASSRAHRGKSGAVDQGARRPVSGWCGRPHMRFPVGSATPFNVLNKVSKFGISKARHAPVVYTFDLRVSPTPEPRPQAEWFGKETSINSAGNGAAAVAGRRLNLLATENEGLNHRSSLGARTPLGP